MNVTPLVDVVLVLLIVFMIVIPAMTDGVNLEIPAIANVDEKEKDTGPKPLVLSVNRSGRTFLGDVLVPRTDLDESLEGVHRANPEARLVLRGDRGVRYVRVRELFAVAQRVGFPGVSLRVNHAGAQ